MKANIGTDADSGLVHSVIGTAANAGDVTQAHALLHGEEEEAFGDAGYIGVEKRPEARPSVVWRMAMKAGKGARSARRPMTGSRKGSNSSRPLCDPASSTPSGCSSASSATSRCAIAAWPRTPRSSTCCLPWATPEWRVESCRQQVGASGRRRKAPKSAPITPQGMPRAALQADLRPQNSRQIRATDNQRHCMSLAQAFPSCGDIPRSWFTGARHPDKPRYGVVIPIRRSNQPSYDGAVRHGPSMLAPS